MFVLPFLAAFLPHCRQDDGAALCDQERVHQSIQQAKPTLSIGCLEPAAGTTNESLAWLQTQGCRTRTPSADDPSRLDARWWARNSRFMVVLMSLGYQFEVVVLAHVVIRRAGAPAPVLQHM